MNAALESKVGLLDAKEGKTSAENVRLQGQILTMKDRVVKPKILQPQPEHSTLNPKKKKSNNWTIEQFDDAIIETI